MQLKQLLAKDQTDRHWSVVAPMLRRIDQERLWEGWTRPSTATFYESMEQFADEELGLDGYQLVRYLQLGALQAELADHVAATAWRKVPASRARELLRLRGLGMEAAALAGWVQVALEVKTTDALRVAIAKALGGLGETFVRWSVRVPATLLPLLESAMVLALPAATGDPAAPAERARDPDTAFRCLEQIVAAYCATVAKQESA